MQSGLGWLAASAGRVGVDRRFGRVGVLLVGLAVSGCAGGGQVAGLTETRRATVAFESLDGPPPAVFQKFMKSLKDEAGARQIAVVSPGEANYRVRGYLAAHDGGSGTSISWVLDAYDAGQHRAFRLSGEERSSGRMWAAADDAVLQRIARAGMDQFAAFAATAGVATASAGTASAATASAATTGAAGAAAASVAVATPQPTSTVLGWADDWAPESAGIFRSFRREPMRAPEITADAAIPWPASEVPFPRGRPGLEGAGSSLAYAPENR
jgi:hypothetical protein